MIVNLRDEPSYVIKGALWSSRGPWLTLRACSILKATMPPTPMDGDVVLHRDAVAFLQVVP